MDYKKTAEIVYQAAGKKENVISVIHCATRIRLTIADNGKVERKKLEKVEGVKGIVMTGGLIQIVFGTGIVNQVYDELEKLRKKEHNEGDKVTKKVVSKSNLFQRLIQTLGDVFIPIIPAMVASGFLMGIMESLAFLVRHNFLDMNTTSSIYVFSKIFSSAAYTFLPILIAYSAGKKFGGNPFLAAVIGMIMIHPDLQDAWVAAVNGVENTQEVWFGLYSVDMVGYQGHVIPVVIAVWVMSKIERKLHKIVPSMFDLFVTPLLSVFVSGYLTLSVIGPIFVNVENFVLDGAKWLIAMPLGLGSFLAGGAYASTVVAGVHHMYTLIDLGQMANDGITYWMPLASAANMGQGGAALAVAVKTKNVSLRSMALPSALSAFMGITEPAIFGINLRYLKPFIAASIGGGLGALYASVVHLGAEGTGVTGIFGVFLCLEHPLQYIIMMMIAAGSAFLLTWAFAYRDGQKYHNFRKMHIPDGAEEKTELRTSLIKETVPGMTSNPMNRELVNLVKHAENDARNKQEEKWRLSFHLMPITGWLNDPNGLCVYKGEYHVFFQYSPFNEQGGIKFWGHYKSPNLLEWTYLGPAIYADQPFDCHGAYSGSTLVEEDKMIIYYTGNVKLAGDFDYISDGRMSNVISAVSEDGIHFGPKSCLLYNEDFPEDCTCHVRDPQVFKKENTYYMLLGARRRMKQEERDRGEALVYTSTDRKTWALKNRITTKEELGYMWECPNYFEIDKIKILFFCSQNRSWVGEKVKKHYQSGYLELIGELDGDYKLGSFIPLDYGFDFYAPQIFCDSNERTILIGWGGMPESEYTNPTSKYGWQNCLTIPRELKFEDGRLLQQPVKELEQLRRKGEFVKILERYERQECSVYELLLETSSDFEINIGLDVKISYQSKTEQVLLVLKNETASGRTARTAKVVDLKNIRILVDTSCIEIFINDGEMVMTTRFYPEKEYHRLSVTAPQGELRLWEMDNMQVFIKE